MPLYNNSSGTGIIDLSTANATGVLPVSKGGNGVTTSTGTGNSVLSNSPTLVTPILGTPTSGVATNLTGLPLTTGTIGILPIAKGGTGSATQNFVDLTTLQTVAGNKSFTGVVNVGTSTSATTYNGLTVAGTGLTTTNDTNGKLVVGRYSAGVPHSYIKMGTGSSGFRFTNAADSGDVMCMLNTGNVGINTNTPTAKLEINNVTVNTSGLKFTQLTSASPSTVAAVNIGINTTGNVVVSKPLIVICRNKTTQLITSATWTVLTNWTEIIDNENAFANATGIFTAPRAMTVSFTCGNALNGLSGQYVGMAIQKVGVQLYNTLHHSGATGIQYLGISGVVELASGETLRAINFTSALAGNDSPSASNSWFTIIEIK